MSRCEGGRASKASLSGTLTTLLGELVGRHVEEHLDGVVSVSSV